MIDKTLTANKGTQVLESSKYLTAAAMLGFIVKYDTTYSMCQDAMVEYDEKSSDYVSQVEA